MPVIVTAIAATASYALAGRPLYAAITAALALLAAVLQRAVIPRIERLHGRLQAHDTTAIRGFRRMHVTAIGANLAQLVLTVGSLVTLSMQMR